MLSGEILHVYKCCIEMSTLYRHPYPKPISYIKKSKSRQKNIFNTRKLKKTNININVEWDYDEKELLDNLNLVLFWNVYP